MLSCEDKLVVVQTDIKWVWDLKCYYCLDLANTVPIQAKPLHLWLEKEACLDFYLDELVAKGIIGLILLGK